MPSRRPLAAVSVAAALAALTAAPAAPPAAEAKGRSADLRAFGSCEALLGYARSQSARMLGTGWVPTGPLPPGAVSGPMPMPAPPAPMPESGDGARQEAAGAPVATAAPAPAAPSGSGSGTTAPDFSTTNVQEEGVDEPDTVKTDGKRIFAVAGGVLRIVDARAAEPRLLGSLPLAEGSGHELLLHDDRVMVLQNAWLADAPTAGAAQAPEPVPPPTTGPATSMPVGPAGRPVTRLTEVDVSDPTAPRVLRTDRVDGSYVTARQVGDVARVVLTTPSRALEPLVEAEAEAGAEGDQPSIAARRALVRRTRLPAWRPRTLSRERGRTALRPITPCREVLHPVTPSGVDMVSVLTIDLDRGLPAVDADAVMATAETVYASPGRLYVATRRWRPPTEATTAEPPATRTELHAFDIAARDRTEHLATGEVRGYLLNQFALSEHDGHLRVASTDLPTWWNGAPNGPPQSESAVDVLDARTLKPVGRAGGLGRGERIYAVRFLGDRGYVVTFRQVDPLYTVDLSTPAQPRVAGELKIEGYSAYLHPIGEHLLLGVGRDATPEGRVNGTQLSVFDVANPAQPTRTAVLALESSSSSTVESDHRAFLWWSPTQLAVVPLAAYDSRSGRSFVGAGGFAVTRDAITERARLAHPSSPFPVPIGRSLVVGPRLFTVSERGVLAADLASLAPGPFVAFGEAAR